MAKVLCITGMHRSGTSLTASWISSCGLVIDNGKTLGPRESNPLGHFEDKDFVDLQSSMISVLDHKSSGWKIYPNHGLYFDDDHTLLAKSIINTRDQINNFWGWKDPRSVLFLEQWKDLVPNMQTLIVWRPCELVVSSLLQRSKRQKKRSTSISIFQAAKLWITHNKAVIRYMRHYDKETILLPIESLIDSDRPIIDLINNKCDIQLKYQPISNLYDTSLLSLNTSSILIKSVCAFYKAPFIEKKLTQYSDVLPGC